MDAGRIGMLAVLNLVHFFTIFWIGILEMFNFLTNLKSYYKHLSEDSRLLFKSHLSFSSLQQGEHQTKCFGFKQGKPASKCQVIMF